MSDLRDLRPSEATGQADRAASAQHLVRLGRISYVNMAPVFFRVEAEFEEVTGVPTELNRKLVAGEIDTAPISSIEWARNADRLRLLPRLCVSSEGAIDSIQLVSRRPLDEVRVIAVSRLLLDNVENVKAYWIMMGMPMAQVALHFGANDVQGTVVREQIFQAAGATSGTEQKIAELVRFVRAAGRVPVQRDTLYNELRRWDD